MITWKSLISPTSAQVVMIISDQTDTPLVWKSTFQEEGFTTVYETPEKALEKCKAIDPALVIIDTHYPHAKRLELCSQIRAVTPSPILLLVQDYNCNHMIDIYNIGIDECLLKPISPAFLMVKVLSLFLQRRWGPRRTSDGSSD